MEKLILALLMIGISGSAFAETYLCIGAAGSTVSYNTKTDLFGAKIRDMTATKFILSKNSQNWSVQHFGNKKIWLTCYSKFWCARDDGYYEGMFRRHTNNVFEAIFIQSHKKSGLLETVTIQGKCSIIEMI